MSLVQPLLQAVVGLDGEALVIHVGEKPYVVTPSGQVELATRSLTFEAVVGILEQLLPVESQRALDEFGAMQYEFPKLDQFRNEHFTVVAACGGEDIWVEIRRRRALDDDAVPASVFATAEPLPAHDPDSMQPSDADLAMPDSSQLWPAHPQAADEAPPEMVSAVDVPAPEASELPPLDLPDSIGINQPKWPTPAKVTPLYSVPRRIPPPEPVKEVPTVTLPTITLPPPVPVRQPITPAAFAPPPAPEPVAVVPPPPPEPVEVAPPPPPVRLPITPAAFVPPPVPPPVLEVAPPPPPAPVFEPELELEPEPEPEPIELPVQAAPPPVVPAPIQMAAPPPEPVEVAPPPPEPVEVTPPPPVRQPITPAAFVPPPPREPVRQPITPAAFVPPPAPPPVLKVAPPPPPAAVFEPELEPEPEPEPEPIELPVQAVPPPVVPAPPPIQMAAPPPEPVEVVPPPVRQPITPAAFVPPPAEPEPVLEPDLEPEAEPVSLETIESVPEPLQAVVLPISRGLHGDALSGVPGQALSGLDRLLRVAAARGASTLYLASKARPSVRVNGEIQMLEEPALGPDDVESLLIDLMPDRNRDALRTGVGTEWVCDVADVGRVRCMSFRDHRGAGAIFRMTPLRAISAEQLGLSRDIRALAAESEGLVLITGPQSSGKTTLLSAFVDLINRTRRVYVITIENEIRVVHENRLSLISQREAPKDRNDLLGAARAAMREEPDVLVLSQLPSADLLLFALDAAGSGHLVITTVAAQTAIGAIDQILGVCPADQRRSVQLALAETLRGVVAQVLVRKPGGGHVAARELLLNTSAVASSIAEGKTSQIASTMESGRKYGMVPLNDELVARVKTGEVDAREAYRRAADRAGFLALLKRQGIDTTFAERLA